jgi:hypothetical protein
MDSPVDIDSCTIRADTSSLVDVGNCCVELIKAVYKSPCVRHDQKMLLLGCLADPTRFDVQGKWPENYCPAGPLVDKITNIYDQKQFDAWKKSYKAVLSREERHDEALLASIRMNLHNGV